jgi:hypothetical protein
LKTTAAFENKNYNQDQEDMIKIEDYEDDEISGNRELSTMPQNIF